MNGNKMKTDRIKILPILIIIAMLTFSVRLVGILSGTPELSSAGTAHAEDKPEDKPEAPPKGSGEGEGNGDEMDLNDPPPSEDESSKWRDASDEELQYGSVSAEMFQDIVARRKGLEKREKSIVTREALLRAAEQEIDRKYQELSQLRTDIEGLLVQQSEEEMASIQSLVTVYEGMKAKDAARIFDTLDLDVLVAVLSKMSERKLSPILAAMNPERARTVTIILAEQKQLPKLPNSN